MDTPARTSSRVSAEEAGGLALAAEVAGDRGAVRAAAGLAADVAEAWLAEARALVDLPASTRADRLRRLAVGLVAPLGVEAADLRLAEAGFERHLLARGRALLAAQAPAALGARWAAEAPAVRRGYVASTALRRLVREALAGAGEEQR
jgi:hypothetical protein